MAHRDACALENGLIDSGINLGAERGFLGVLGT